MSAVEPDSTERDKLIRARTKIIGELKSTEETYLNNITLLRNFFTLPPLDDKASPEEIVKHKKHLEAVERFKTTPAGKAFIAEIEKIKPIEDLSKALYLELQKDSIDSLSVGRIFQSLNFNDYNQYLESQASISALCTSLQKENKDFQMLVKDFEESRRMTLGSFLILPVQRVPRYKLMLIELRKTEEKLEALQRKNLKEIEGQAVPAAVSEVVSTLDMSIAKVNTAAVLANTVVGKQADLATLAQWTNILKNNGYSTRENRALRSVRKAGDISDFFNTEESLKRLKEELEKNEAFQKLVSNQKITFRYKKSGKKKNALIIECILNGQPLCKIRQKAYKDGKKEFYVRMKTDFKKLTDGETLENGGMLDYDKVKAQLDIAEAVSKAVVEVVKEPFAGYTKIPGQKKESGKQKKAPDAGRYIRTSDGKECFIKRAKSEKHMDDDVVEPIAGRLNALAMGAEHAVQYEFVPNRKDKTVYVVSEVTGKTLADSVDLTLRPPGADLLWSKDAVYKALSPGQRKGMARVLAGALWIREIDPQYRNILVDDVDKTTKKPLSDIVKKFDNGWSLSEICGSGHEQVRLFETLPLVRDEPVGTHGRKGIPTNHFNDYPKIIRSQDFVDALEETLKETTEANINAVIKKSMDEIKKAYGKDEFGNSTDEHYKRALELFAQHMHLDIIGHDDDTRELAKYIEKALSKRLKERATSMALLQRMIAIDLAIELALTTKDPQAIQEVGRLAMELQYVVYEKYNNQLTCFKDILPPYEPEFFKLMEAAATLTSSLALIQEDRDAIAFCLALSDKSHAEKRLAGKPGEARWLDEGCSICLVFSERTYDKNLIRTGKEIAIVDTTGRGDLSIYYKNAYGRLDFFRCSEELEKRLSSLEFNNEILDKNEESQEIYAEIYREVISRGGYAFPDSEWKPPKPAEKPATKTDPSADLMSRVHRLSMAKRALERERVLTNPMVEPHPFSVGHDSSKMTLTTADKQSHQKFVQYCQSLQTNFGNEHKTVNEQTNSVMIFVNSEQTKKKNEFGAVGQPISVTHMLKDHSIKTDFPSAAANDAEGWRKIFQTVLQANIDAGLTQLSPSGTFENVKYMTEEILKQGITPVFSPETQKLLEAHAFTEATFLADIKAKIPPVDKPPFFRSHL